MDTENISIGYSEMLGDNLLNNNLQMFKQVLENDILALNSNVSRTRVLKLLNRDLPVLLENINQQILALEKEI